MSVWIESLASLALPARMQNVAARLGLTTVGDLARVHPASLLLEDGFGQKTLAETRALLEPVLGMRWEDAASHEEDADDDEDVRIVSGMLDPSVLGWDGLAVVLPEPLRARAVLDAPLPPRLVSYAVATGLATVGALVKVRRAEIERAPSIGKRTLLDATAMLLRLRAALAEQGPVVAAEWRRYLVETLATLPVRERTILGQRIGLVGPPPTLAELAETLGVSRERVRQIEGALLAKIRREAAWVSPLAEALRAVCPPFAEPLADIRVHGAPLVAHPEADRDAFAALLEGILEGRAGHVVVHDGTAYYGRISPDSFEKKRARVAFMLERTSLPKDLRALHDEVRVGAGLAPDEVAPLFALFRGVLVVDDAGKAVAYRGEGTAAEMRAFLRGAGRPVATSEVAARFGRVALPDDVVRLERDVVTLPELVPGFDAWVARIGPLVVPIMAEHGRARRFGADELLPLVATRAELPEWMSPFTLASLLRRAEGVVSLAGQRFALARPAGTAAHLDEAMEDELAKAGAPLAEDELLARVRARRAVDEAAWAEARARAPFVLLDNATIGLHPRDVEGKEAAAKLLCDTTAEWLEQRDAGADPDAQHGFFSSLGAPMGTYGRRLVRSLLRHDGRFRFAPGGGLGLAAWGDARTKTDREALVELLDAHDGTARVADVLAALPTANGDELPRVRLALLAAQVGARLVGDAVTRAFAPEPSLGDAPARDRPWLLRVPEKATRVFAHALAHARSEPELRVALEEWRVGMDKLVGFPVDRAQVARLAALAAELLSVAATDRDAEHARAVRAAVEYLVRVDDGESDLVTGGLDDDEAVLVAVRVARAGRAHAESCA